MSMGYIDLPIASGSGGGVTSLNSLTGALTLVAGSNITITPSGSSITIASTGGGGSGTVTSVALSAPSFLSVSGSPITSSGTLALSLAPQAANLVFAGPATGAAATPTFRSLVAADVPALGYVTSVAATVPSFLSVSGSPITSSGTLAISYSGTALPVANGGTGVTSLGNLTDSTSGSDGITITGGTRSVISNVSIAQSQASGSQNGFLASTDWSTFNGKQAAGNYITALTGPITASGPGSSATTISANVIANSNLAQMSADTIKGNNTGSTANASDLTATQVTAMLNAFVGDSGSGGTQGLVPAPPTGSEAAGDFLSSNGSWSYVDQSKTINQPFSLITQLATSGAAGSIKYECTAVYTSIVNGKNYALGTGFIGTPTLSIWDISDQTSPVLVGSFVASGGGIYNVTVGVVSGVQYAFVGYNSGSHFVVINLTNPYNPVQTSSTVITGSPGSIYGVSFLNGYVYCATQSAGLVVMDVGGGTGSPTVPVQTYTQGSPYKSFGVVAIGTNVYTTYYSTSSPYTVRDILSWTLTSPGSASVPSLLQTLQVTAAGEALGLSVNGNTAFVTTAASGAYNINLVDITTPSSMSNLSQIHSSNTFGSAFYAVGNGNIVYVPSGGNATYGGAIDAYDISNRSLPVHIAQVTTKQPNSVFGVPALSGGYMFVADYAVATSGAAGYLDVFTQLETSPVFDQAVGYSLALNNLNLSTSQTTYTGSSSGTAVWSMPFQGSSYKKFLINLASLTDAGGTITFPTAFSQTPYLYGATAAVAVSSATATTFTLMSTTSISGLVFVEGY